MLTMMCAMMMCICGPNELVITSTCEINPRVWEYRDSRPIVIFNKLPYVGADDIVVDVVDATETVREVNEVSQRHGTTDVFILDPSDGTDLLAHGHYQRDPNTEYEITTHKRVFELRFKWRGEDRVVSHEEVLWTSTRKLKLQSQWVPDGKPIVEKPEEMQLIKWSK